MNFFAGLFITFLTIIALSYIIGHWSLPVVAVLTWALWKYSEWETNGKVKTT